MSDLEYVIGALLRGKKLTLGVVESATGGLISHLITNVPGSSNYFKGSITAYANAAKRKLAGVKASTLNQYGAVSPQVAVEMADGGRRALVVDLCIADTGIEHGIGSAVFQGYFQVATAADESEQVSGISISVTETGNGPVAYVYSQFRFQ